MAVGREWRWECTPKSRRTTGGAEPKEWRWESESHFCASWRLPYNVPLPSTMRVIILPSMHLDWPPATTILADIPYVKPTPHDKYSCLSRKFSIPTPPVLHSAKRRVSLAHLFLPSILAYLTLQEGSITICILPAWSSSLLLSRVLSSWTLSWWTSSS